MHKNSKATSRSYKIERGHIGPKMKIKNELKRQKKGRGLKAICFAAEGLSRNCLQRIDWILDLCSIWRQNDFSQNEWFFKTDGIVSLRVWSSKAPWLRLLPLLPPGAPIDWRCNIRQTLSWALNYQCTSWSITKRNRILLPCWISICKSAGHEITVARLEDR